MKVPEKIYLYTEGNTLDNDWLYEAPKEFISFEYTNTDAFIEKACKWLKENVLFTHPRKGTKVCAVNLIAFVDAMKGK